MTARTSRRLGAVVIRSSMWMLLNSAVTRGITFASQIVLAIILTKADFGVYAAAMSIAAFLTNLRGAGMTQWLTQGGRERFAERAGHAFWTSLSFNVILGLIIIALAPIAADFFGDAQVKLVLIVIGASFPIITIGSYYRNVLAIDLRTREVAVIEVSSALLRYVLIIVFAIVGMGALSFVIPLPITFALEGLIGYFYTTDKIWRKRSNPRRWISLVVTNKWILVGTFVTTVTLQADFFTLGKLATLTTLGVYYFAYQMTYMSAGLVTESVRRVLFPALVVVPAERRPASALHAAMICTVLGAPLLTVGAVVIAPLEQLIWHGKWADAVLPIQLLSLGMPLQLATTVTQSSLQSEGRFRLWSAVNTMRGVLVVAGALIAGVFFPRDVSKIAAIMTVALAFGNGTQVCAVYKAQGVRLFDVVRQCLASVLVAPIALCATLGIAEAIHVGPILVLFWNLAVFAVLWGLLTLIFDRTAVRNAVAAARSAISRTAPSA